MALLPEGRRDASPPLETFPSERVFPIRMHLVTNRGRALEAFASLDPTRNLQEGGDLGYELAASSSNSTSTPSGANEKVGKARTAQYQEDTKPENLSSSEPLHTISERLTLASSKASDEFSVRSNHGGAVFHRCEDEPIHIPGAIQRFGALVALTPSGDGGEWSVRIGSENCEDVLGYSPQQLFKLPSFANILYDESRHDFEESAAAVWAGRFSDRRDTKLEISSIALKPRHGKFSTLWCAMHIAEGNAPILICEFEDQRQRPSLELLECTALSASSADIVSSSQQHTKHTNADSHLRSLRAARLRRASLNVLDTVNAVADIQQQLGAVDSVQELLELVTVMVRELTQFHRVMLYQFDKGANGTVVAESVDANASEDRYEGLRFPHSDIPKQARDLYKINKIRVLYSRDEETARLVCNTPQDAERPLDLTHSYLRAMSPIHLKYLANMGVSASMSISLIVNRELWGLIACHSYTPMRIALPLRELCRTLGTSASTNITKLIYASRLEHRKTLVTGTVKATPSSLVTASSLDLLRIFDADFGLLAIDGEVRAIGKLDPYMEALAVLNFVNHSQFGEITMSDQMAVDFPNEETLALIEILAGILVVPLSKDRSDFIVFIRQGQVKDIHWAGNPNEKGMTSRPESNLEPRSSFKKWTEQVRGTSRAWTSDQCDMAVILRLVYGRFIEVWRQKGQAAHKNKMTQILLRNASHEVRTPLNAIINYTELALYGEPKDQETRENLENSLKASHSLIYVIDDLLNLATSDHSDVLMPEEQFDLSSTVEEVINAFTAEAERRGIELIFSNTFTRPGPLLGDSRRFREVVSHLVNNAFQHAGKGSIKVSVRSVNQGDDVVMIELAVEDTASGMSEKNLDDLFHYFELIADDFEVEEATDPTAQILSIKIGLGLAVVSRFVRNTKGHLRIRSQIGKGTVVAIIVPFRIAKDLPRRQSMSLATSSLERLPMGFGSRGSSNIGIDERTSLTRPPGIPEYPPTIGYVGASMSSPPLSAQMWHPTISEPRSGTTSSSDPMSADLSSHNYQDRYPFPNVSSASEQKPARQLFILIAEDNPINSRMLEHRLSKLGHIVQVATNGQACVDIFEASSKPFDVILMDIQMPLLDGFQATERIRHNEAQKRNFLTTSDPLLPIPIIAISASLEESRRDEYSQKGVDGWMLKPVNFRRLDMMLRGIHDTGLRDVLLSSEVTWGQGGWLTTSV